MNFDYIYHYLVNRCRHRTPVNRKYYDPELNALLIKNITFIAQTSHVGEEFFRLSEVPVLVVDNQHWKALYEASLCLPDYLLSFNTNFRKVKRPGNCYVDRVEIGPLNKEAYNTMYFYMEGKYACCIVNYTKDLTLNTNTIHERKKDICTVGSDSFKDINERCRAKGLIRKDQSLTDKLVGKAKKFKWNLKLTVPRQIGYIDIRNTGRALFGCYKADVSSAFPVQLKLRIPTLKRCKIKFNETQEPTEKYPFVFETDGTTVGIVKILEEDKTYINTATDYQNKYLADCYKQHLASDTNKLVLDKVDIKVVSIACKVADISLADIMEDLYQDKLSGDTKAKMTMNAFIGFMQKNNNPLLAFITAVVIARQNHAMLERCRVLEEERNQVLYIATDSIVWRGHSSKLTVSTKSLGAFVEEYSNCGYYGIQVGSYQISDNDKVITYCSYLENNEYKKNLRFGELPLPKVRKV